ncbi:MAG: type II secretion system protein [Verrucomicrobia bacterium]|nr:type II secretion system protein [Verrucomicrobiota bacterium]
MLRNLQNRQEGLTLVEVAIALGVLSLLCSGVLLVTLHARRFAEHSRVATEAQSLAKERLEDMIAMGFVKMRQSNNISAVDTNLSSLRQPIIRRPRVIWHMGSSTSVYAEVHIDMIFPSPLVKTLVTNTFSTIIQ